MEQDISKYFNTIKGLIEHHENQEDYIEELEKDRDKWKLLAKDFKKELDWRKQSEK